MELRSAMEQILRNKLLLLIYNSTGKLEPNRTSIS